MERKISEWLRMIADPEIRKNAWENWKNRDVKKYPDFLVSNVNHAIYHHANCYDNPQGENYWRHVYNSKITLLSEPIPEAEMDALSDDPLNEGQKFIDNLKDGARRKHEEMRRKLWCDAMVTYYNRTKADTILEIFDKLFPNPIN